MSTAAAPQTPPVEETLGWEAEQRPRAAAAAITAGVLLVGANILALTLFRDFPRARVLTVLQEALSGQRQIKADQVQYVDDHTLEVLVADGVGLAPGVPPGGLLTALSFLAMSLALHYLFRATAARRPETPGFLKYLVVGGPVAAGVGALMASIGRVVAAADIAGASNPTAEAARDALVPPVWQAAQILMFFGMLALGVGTAVLALNAMRTGLLTRFLGVLGMIVGVIWVIQIDFLALVRGFWLVFLGVLLSGRAPSGTPPAWASGRAEPWPTQQELREQREAAKIASATRDEAPDPPPATAAHSKSRKRKRKHRR